MLVGGLGREQETRRKLYRKIQKKKTETTSRLHLIPTSSRLCTQKVKQTVSYADTIESVLRECEEDTQARDNLLYSTLFELALGFGVEELAALQRCISFIQCEW